MRRLDVFFWCFFLFGFTTPILLGSADPAIQVDRSDPTSILRAVKRNGAAAVVRQFTRSRSQWEDVLTHISTGKKIWLEAAQALRPGTDAFATFTLLLTVGQALPKAPVDVLRLTLKGRGFEFDDVCTVPLVEPTDAEILEYLKRAESALTNSMPSDVEQLRLKCLAKLQKRRQEFEVGQKGL